jgi:hypothetical protein
VIDWWEWPEEVYPTYANGPDMLYLLTADSIVSEFTNHKLRVRLDGCFWLACYGNFGVNYLHKIIWNLKIIFELVVEHSKKCQQKTYCSFK